MHEVLEDQDLLNAIDDTESGLSTADLGGGLFKTRVAKRGSGKSGGFRTLLALKIRDRAFFVFGFSKNERDNISKKELYTFKELASTLMELSNDQIELALAKGEILKLQQGDSNA